MIKPHFARVMSRYNKWQNAGLMAAADTLDASALQQDRGAFFGSILGTFNHLLWGDTIWMSRFDGWAAPQGGIADSPGLTEGWAAFRQARTDADTRILDWAQRLQAGDLGGDLAWFSGAANVDVTKAKWQCVQHFFNHQTHHRGQIHAMLTAAGAKPAGTDLFLMPEGE